MASATRRILTINCINPEILNSNSWKCQCIHNFLFITYLREQRILSITPKALSAIDVYRRYAIKMMNMINSLSRFSFSETVYAYLNKIITRVFPCSSFPSLKTELYFFLLILCLLELICTIYNNMAQYISLIGLYIVPIGIWSSSFRGSYSGVFQKVVLI